MIDNSTPVLVLRSDGHGGLNIMRSLGRLGIPVFNLDPDRGAPAFTSAFCRRKFVWDIEHEQVEKSLDYLDCIALEIGRKAILMPTTDRTAAFVAEHTERLSEAYAFPILPPGLVQKLRNKVQMHALARQFGIPTPATVAPRCRADVVNFLEVATFPLMLKAIDSQRAFEKCRKKMFIVKSRKELLEKYDALEDPGDPIFVLQEYIPGGDDTIWMFNGYFNSDSRCLVGYTGRKLRQCPIHTGSTSLGICEENPVVYSVTKSFMQALKYRGILDIGFRYDARDGQYKVLDVNPRIGATFRLFVGENGIDVARALYLDLTGQRVEASPNRNGRKWICEDLDIASTGRYFLQGELSFPHWLKSLRGIDEAAYFARDDIKPLLTMVGVRAVEVLRRTLRLITAAVQRFATHYRNAPRPKRGTASANSRAPIDATTFKLQGRG